MPHRPETRVLTVVDAVQGEYSRTITSRPVTFTCAACGVIETRDQLPGPTPRYCYLCWSTVRAERNAERQRRYRARRRQEGEGTSFRLEVDTA